MRYAFKSQLEAIVGKFWRNFKTGTYMVRLQIIAHQRQTPAGELTRRKQIVAKAVARELRLHLGVDFDHGRGQLVHIWVGAPLGMLGHRGRDDRAQIGRVDQFQLVIGWIRERKDAHDWREAGGQLVTANGHVGVHATCYIMELIIIVWPIIILSYSIDDSSYLVIIFILT